MSAVLTAYESYAALPPTERSRPLDQHAVVLSGGPRVTPEILAERLRDVLAGCPASEERDLRPAVRQPGAVWLENVPFRSDDPRAVQALHRELLRPVPRFGPPPVRLVVLRCEDGDQLVFTAARSCLDGASLTSVARAVADGSGPRLWWDLPAARPDGDERTRADAGAGADPAARAGGAPGSRAAHRFTVPPAPADHRPAPDAAELRAAQLAAVTHTAMRYLDRTDVTVGVVRRRHRSTAVLGATEDAVPLTLTAAGTTGELLARARTALDDLDRSGGAPRESRGGHERGEPSRITVAFDGASPDPGLAHEVAYFPGTWPGAPLVIHWLAEGAEGAEGPQAVCLFDESRHGRELVEQFCRHLAGALRQLLDEPPATPVDRLGLLDGDEDAAIRALGDGGPLDAEPRCVHRAFEEVAAAQPDAVAVGHKRETLTYRQLDERANRFAHALRDLGVEGGDRVGVCMERSTDLVVVLLAVLKSGAAYVPMDVGYPVERLAYTAKDAGLRLVIGSEETSDPGIPSVRTVSVADLALRADARPPTPVTDRTDPGRPAYVIYTSGTTGQPKGVAVPHRNVTALVEATRPDFGFSDRDVWSQFHSVAFDFSVWEIWGCLLTGGRLVLVPYFAARSPEAFLELLVAEKVTVLNQTPSAFGELVRLHRPGAAVGTVSVRLLVFGGEALDPRVLRPCLDEDGWSRCRFVNMFGITETTVHVTAQTVTRAEILHGDRSVGRPLPGWSVTVRDSGGRLLPRGVRGEIHVGGAGVALGYLGRPELTAERFVEDPATGGRVYRSGDCGRLLPDGRIEHLGRLDSQVKIRGYRIETDEVRAVLLEDPALSDAVVIPGPDNAGGLRLDAYLIFRDGTGTAYGTAEVRERAAKVLPQYMLPSTWTPMSEIPRTLNGKLDAAKLPAPRPASAGDARPAEETSGRRADGPSGPRADGPSGPRADEPDGPLALVCSAWSEVFGFTVGPDDDFFGIGGNSLLATRLSAVFREKGLPPPRTRDMYRNPTPRAIAALLDR
ncbi:amino acid adenylation domain-containing protein [Streptomyces griseiscabiei]|uniref:Amino acid adenylation domain-containing protein n=2 Tax=Streptomyces griseiscabiei TaxID=2993540 RepID=A0ABU4L1W3_9ACTN|nr:amino acid adenylation domain-containing protein [Streptomyces griseiscabiei]MBZ3906093.1 amino acid adenylation domain-containing protein [Streptomyces griseiscabiei]MDX2909727.1 amino acid adenylation domain-containing protein [Streptomyces griseiscabiei]